MGWSLAGAPLLRVLGSKISISEFSFLFFCYKDPNKSLLFGLVFFGCRYFEGWFFPKLNLSACFAGLFREF